MTRFEPLQRQRDTLRQLLVRRHTDHGEQCLRARQSPLTDLAVKVYKAQQSSELKELHLELHSLCPEDLLD